MDRPVISPPTLLPPSPSPLLDAERVYSPFFWAISTKKRTREQFFDPLFFLRQPLVSTDRRIHKSHMMRLTMVNSQRKGSNKKRIIHTYTKERRTHNGIDWSRWTLAKRTNNSNNRKYRRNADFSLGPNYLRASDKNIFICRKGT